MTDIAITQTSDEPGARNLKVEVSVERVEAAERKAAKSLAKRAKLPGFRAGKAPIGVILKKYRDAIRESVLRELLQESWKTAIDQEGLEPIDEPLVKDLKFEAGEPITFNMTVAVKPDLALDRLTGFTLSRRLPKVTDDLVDAQIDDLRRKRAPWVPVADRQPTQGELVSMAITPLDDGTAGESRQYQIVVGEGQALPDVEEKLMQMKPGESEETTVRFPDDYPDETKRGETRSVRLELGEVKRQDLPELDGDFAREVGDFESFTALRDAVRSDLEAEARREADADVRSKLMGEIIAANNVDAPKSMVRRALGALAKAYQVPDDQLEKFATEFGPIAERQVKRDLVIEFVAERENLKATEKDVDRHIEKIAELRKAEPSQIYASLQKANRLGELERGLTEDKVFEYLLNQSTTVDETD